MTIDVKWSDFNNLDVEQTLATANRLLPRWVALALVVGIAWQLARIIWMVVPGSDVGDQLITPPEQITRSAGSAAGSIDVQSIANTHLFGEADATVVEAFAAF